MHRPATGVRQYVSAFPGFPNRWGLASSRRRFFARKLQWNGTSFTLKSGPFATGAFQDTVRGIIAIGTKDSDIIAVGSGGTIVGYSGTGTTWTRLITASTATYNGIWGVQGNQWVVGNSGVILHGQDTTFSADASSGALTTRNLEAVWGSSISDVWAVGEGGVILHYDGSKWTSIASSTSLNIYGVWGSSASDIWAVGQGGLILHYDGQSWTRWEDRPTANDLYGVWGSGAGDVTFVGANGTILRYSN